MSYVLIYYIDRCIYFIFDFLEGLDFENKSEFAWGLERSKVTILTINIFLYITEEVYGLVEH
jgi:hypothetical protein